MGVNLISIVSRCLLQRIHRIQSLRKRKMEQLACRFCTNGRYVHVVDPVVDLRYRFSDKQKLSQMLHSRGLSIDVNEVHSKYEHWWSAYQKWIGEKTKLSSVDRMNTNISIWRQKLLDESDGLLGALSLPNDVYCEHTYSNVDSNCSSKSIVEPSMHMNLLGDAGMIKVSTPYMVRGAIIDALNFSEHIFPKFTAGTDSSNYFYLAGRSLASILCPLVKTRSNITGNTWPIRLMTAGASYKNISSLNNHRLPEQIDLYNAPQQFLFSIVILCRSKIEEFEESRNILDRLGTIFTKMFSFNCSKESIPTKELLNYESSAAVLKTERGAKIARVSLSGAYVSSRLNIMYVSKEVTDFVRLVNVEIDILRIVASIMDDPLINSQSMTNQIQRLMNGEV